MMDAKKLQMFSALLVTLLVLSFAACNKNSEQNSNDVGVDAGSSSTESSNVLVSTPDSFWDELTDDAVVSQDDEVSDEQISSSSKEDKDVSSKSSSPSPSSSSPNSSSTSSSSSNPSSANSSSGSPSDDEPEESEPNSSTDTNSPDVDDGFFPGSW